MTHGSPAMLINTQYNKAGRLQYCFYASLATGIHRFTPGTPAFPKRYCPHFITLDFSLRNLSI
ncbi:MAG: hypothetical protein OIF58_05135 [Cohaesibacter sp.]|nr:hypothetical protein [Cohaesibacter sp.]